MSVRVRYKHNASRCVTGFERRIGLVEDGWEGRETDHFCTLQTCDVVHLPMFPLLVQLYFARWL